MFLIVVSLASLSFPVEKVWEVETFASFRGFKRRFFFQKWCVKTEHLFCTDSSLTHHFPHAESITMDPNTAHPRVALAEDNTELYTLAESRDVPDHPGRYDVVLATLGATGFSSGRRYWEVSVADRLCYHVGLAAASAQRKGILRFAPQNGYWTLILNKQGQLRALDRMPKVLPVQAPPGALGVLLDYRNGQVSFYDTGSRSHLYSFSGNSFTDELFPFINFCNEDIDSQTPIRLIPPGSTDWLQ